MPTRFYGAVGKIFRETIDGLRRPAVHGGSIFTLLPPAGNACPVRLPGGRRRGAVSRGSIRFRFLVELARGVCYFSACSQYGQAGNAALVLSYPRHGLLRQSRDTIAQMMRRHFARVELVVGAVTSTRLSARRKAPRDILLSNSSTWLAEEEMAPAPSAPKLQHIPPSEIARNPENPRLVFRQDEMESLDGLHRPARSSGPVGGLQGRRELSSSRW